MTTRIPALPTPNDEHEFKVIRSLPACRVTREWIERFENEFLAYASEVMDRPVPLLREYYSVRVKDGEGTATYRGVTQMLDPLFSDSTTEVSIELKYLGELQGQTDRLVIELEFNCNSAGVLIRVRQKRSRELALMLADRITKMAGSIRHFDSGNFSGILFGIGLVAFLPLCIVLGISPTKDIGFVIVYAIVIGLLLLLGKLAPTNSFDSIADDRNRKIAFWIGVTAIGFTIIGPILTNLASNYIWKFLLHQS
jgi:hypothetical protein